MHQRTFLHLPSYTSYRALKFEGCIKTITVEKLYDKKNT